MYFIAILCIMGALLVSRCSGTELSNYGSKAHLIISGNVYKITNPLTVIAWCRGLSCSSKGNKGKFLRLSSCYKMSIKNR